MSTGTDIITRALQKIGAASAVSAPSANSIETGMEALNSMLALWASQGIDAGATPLSVAGDELNERLDCRSAIISNLAVCLAPDFDNGKNIVSHVLAAQAARQYAEIARLRLTITIPAKVASSTLPKGQGGQYGPW